jgi:MYXO-CTERM domain-containing protein
VSGPAPAVQPRRGVARAQAALAAVLLAALLAAPMPGTAQSAGTVVVDASGSGTAHVDLRGDAGKAIAFTLREEDFSAAKGSSSMLVYLVRSATGDELSVAAQRASDGVWTGVLAVDTPDLVAGDWKVVYYAVRPLPTGAGIIKQRLLNVTLLDHDLPRLDVMPLGDPIRLGPGGSLEIAVEEAFLRSVTVMHSALPQPLRLTAPYRLSVEALAEGVTEVTVTAADRAGHVSTATVKVDRDTIAPGLHVDVPEVGYTGVPFAIVANSTERSLHVVRIIHNATAETRTVAGAAADHTTTHVFITTIATVGEAAYTVEAIDAVGNRVSTTFVVPIVAPPTDIRAVALGLAPGPAPFVGQEAIVVATLEQVGGVTALPVTVTFTSGSHQKSMTVTLPAVGTKLVEWNVSLAPGPREVSVHVAGPSFANETNPGNENATATVETFLGSARVGDDLYFIRADRRGLPVAAVEEGTTTSHTLKLVQDGKGVQYHFELPGNRTGVWDPLEPIAPEPQPATSSSSSSTGSKGAAAPGLLMVLAVVAIAALVQRRK